MRQIGLTQSQVALIDDDMYEKLSQHKWFAHKDRNTFYAYRWSPKNNGNRHLIQMHHEIIGRPPEGLETDHRNGLGTDNQRENLRHVTRRQNGQNRKNQKKTSKYPGVYWHKKAKRWMTQLKINGEHKHLGRFINELDAFQAYKQAVEANGETMI